MRRRPAGVAALLAGALCACGGAPKTGTAEMRFGISDSARNSANLRDPLVGTFRGNIFLREDVSITGPRDGVMRFQDIVVENVDLRGSVMASTATFHTKELEPNTYVVLGFLDVDGNGASGDPDPGDPVTLALTNEFTVVTGMQAKRLVLFELIYN